MGSEKFSHPRIAMSRYTDVPAPKKTAAGKRRFTDGKDSRGVGYFLAFGAAAFFRFK
jgi:hypothetical protein